MKKSIIALCILASASIALCACTGSDNGRSNEHDSDDEETIEETEESEIEGSIETVPDIKNTVSYDIQAAYPFSDGLAWVQYNGKFGVIDEDAMVVFEVDSPIRGATVFFDGASLYETNDGVYIVDSNGNNLAIYENTESDFFRGRGYCGKYIILKKHSDMNGETKYVTIVDKNGNELSQTREIVTNDFDAGLADMSEGMFYLPEDDLFINLNTGEFIVYSSEDTGWSHPEDGVTKKFIDGYLALRATHTVPLGLLDTSAFNNQNSFDNALNSGLHTIYSNVNFNSIYGDSCWPAAPVGKYVSVKYNPSPDNMFSFRSCDIYNAYTYEKVCTCPTYGDNVSYISACVSGNYILNYLQGADGYYATILDMNGNQLYTPVKISDTPGSIIFDRGYILFSPAYGDPFIVTLEGRKLSLQDNLSEISDFATMFDRNVDISPSSDFYDLRYRFWSLINYTCGNQYLVNDGFILLDGVSSNIHGYQRLSDNTQITAVNVAE